MSQTDEFGKHEVLHMSSVIGNLWDNEITQHETVTSDPELYKAAYQIAVALASFYQICGKKFL